MCKHSSFSERRLGEKELGGRGEKAPAWHGLALALAWLPESFHISFVSGEITLETGVEREEWSVDLSFVKSGMNEINGICSTSLKLYAL